MSHGGSESAAAQVDNQMKPEDYQSPLIAPSMFFAGKTVGGAIKTSLLTADCHQQFATSSK